MSVIPDQSLIQLDHDIKACNLCPRLRDHCRQIAQKKTARFRDHSYYGLPVPNFGDRNARLLIVGLAPAAHGANRTGRMFTGDRSGDWLFRALFETGFANQPTATGIGDGLELKDAMITAVTHCAPPGNKPTTRELANCRVFLDQTFDLLPRLVVAICLGRIAFHSVLKRYKRKGWIDKISA